MHFLKDQCEKVRYRGAYLLLTVALSLPFLAPTVEIRVAHGIGNKQEGSWTPPNLCMAGQLTRLHVVIEQL